MPAGQSRREAAPGRRFLPLLAAALLIFGAGTAFAGEAIGAAVAGKVAIEGYDPVAYFADGRAAAGSDKFEYAWNGATWRFASAQHRDTFAANPERYAPQYGGYSAYGVSLGSIDASDPRIWSIVEEKLYLNASKEVRAQWLAAVPSYIGTANGKWPNLESGLTQQ